MRRILQGGTPLASKSVLALAFACLLGVGPAAGVARAKGPPTTKTSLDTTPTSAQAFLVTQEGETGLGVTPLENVKLPRGLVTLRFQKEGFRELLETVEIGTKPRSFVFNLLREVKPAVLEFMGDAAFHGAAVTVDGKGEGSLPATVTVPPGRHQAVVTKDGFEPWERWIDATEGQRVSFEVVLKAKARPKGALLATSTPTGAQLRLNGAPRGVTPTVVEDLPAGEYAVELVLEDYKPWSGKVEVPEGGRATVDAKLEPVRGATGELVVTADVEGAAVWIDGKEAGPAPVTRSDLRPGSHRVEARAEGHSPASEVVEVRAGETSVVKLSLKDATRTATGTVRVVANVAGAQASLDGAPAEPVPLVRDDVRMGTHFVSVTAPGHAPWKKTIQVEPGGTLEVAAELVLAGWLHVEVKGGAPAEVFLDGKLVGKAPLKAEIATGTYTLTVKREDGKIEETAIAIGLDAPVKYKATFGAGAVKVKHRAMPWSAQPIDKGYGAADAGVGFPWLFHARISGGLQGGLELGLAIRSAGDALTEFAARGKYLLARSRAFAAAAEGDVGFGLGGDERNAFVASARLLGSILISERAAVTLRVGGSFASDRTGPQEEGLDEHAERQTGLALTTGLSIEFRVGKFWNGFLLGELGPAGDARRVLGEGVLGDAAEQTWQVGGGISLLF